MKQTQQQEKLKKQSIHSVMLITSMEYRNANLEFSPEGRW